MLVYELIEILAKYPPNWTVEIESFDDYDEFWLTPVNNVYQEVLPRRGYEEHLPNLVLTSKLIQ